jgi:hypothetical protein
MWKTFYDGSKDADTADVCVEYLKCTQKSRSSARENNDRC